MNADGRNVDGAANSRSWATELLEAATLVKSESMDITNDPRFFQDNIINQRLAAFAGLAVVSGLLVQNAMDNICDMNKRMYKLHIFENVDQLLTFVSFIMLLFVFILNMLAVYVGVAQPYHTIRLVTAGPTGFEAAAAYYLNKDIIAWRHIAIKGMLYSLPLYVVQLGLRLMVKFDRTTRDAPELPEDTPFWSHIQGVSFGSFLILYGCMMYCVHVKHQAVFREGYENIGIKKNSALQMQTLMAPRSHAPNRNWGLLDV